MKSSYEYFVGKMLRALLAEWPGWERYLQTPRHLLRRGFWFVVPAPNQDLTRGLSVSTDERRVIVGLDDDHDHLWQGKKETLPEFRRRVLARIHDLMEDRIRAVSWRDAEGRLRTSSCFREEEEDYRYVEPGYTKRVRSWSGKRDEDSLVG